MWTPSGNALAVKTANNTISVGVSAALELNAATAQYQTLPSDGAASDWLPVSAVTTVSSNTLQLRVDNVPVRPAVNGVLTTIQFRVSPSGADNTAFACSGAYSLFAANNFVYMPTLSRAVISNVIDLTTATEPDNSACQANYSLLPNQSYVARLNDTNDYYKIVVSQKATLRFTVTNFTQAGQVQLRSLVGGDCNNLALPVVFFQSAPGAIRSLVATNVEPGTYYFRIVLTTGSTPPNIDYLMEYSTSTATPSPYEPNNTPCTAAKILPSTDIVAYPDDDNDWYVFDLLIRSNIKLVASHAVTNMQYLIYRGAACTDITSNDLPPLVILDGGKTNVTLDIANAPVAKYFVRVAPTDGYKSGTASYTFKVTTTSALLAANKNTEMTANMPSDQTPVPLVLESEEEPIP